MDYFKAARNLAEYFRSYAKNSAIRDRCEQEVWLVEKGFANHYASLCDVRKAKWPRSTKRLVTDY